MATSSMFPGIGGAPLGLDMMDIEQDDTPALEIMIDNPDDVQIGIDDLTIDLMPEEEKEGFGDNLAEYMSQGDLHTVASDLLELVDADFARRLERERNEALMDRDDGDMAIMTRNHYERILKERNEAIRQFENLKASSIHTCHDQCQRPMCVLRRERDKWEETARLYCQNSDYHREMREKAERERDEAREELNRYKRQWEESRSENVEGAK